MPEFLIGMLIAVLAVSVLLLVLKLHSLRKTVREIDEELKSKLDIDTNTPVSVSGYDSCARRLARDINKDLERLHFQRRKYESQNDEIKVAVTNIAHDIRTPLTAINGYLELLSDASLTPEEKSWLSVVCEKTDELKELTEELFSYSTAYSDANNLKLSDTNINDELENAIAGFYGAFKQAGIEPEITITDCPVIRKLDKRAFLRILNNLLNNAMKYSQGDLRIELSERGCICVSNKVDNLSAVDVSKLFDRFFTVQTAKGSTGLGLSIAKLLTEKMNGKISAQLSDNVLIIKIEWRE